MEGKTAITLDNGGEVMDTFVIATDNKISRDSIINYVYEELKSNKGTLTLQRLKKVKSSFYTKMDDKEYPPEYGWDHEDLKFMTCRESLGAGLGDDSYEIILPLPHKVEVHRVIEVRYKGEDKFVVYKDVVDYTVSKDYLILTRSVGLHYILFNSIIEFVEEKDDKD